MRRIGNAFARGRRCRIFRSMDNPTPPQFDLVMTREKNRVALTSVFAAVFLTGIKLGVGLWTNSLGILSEAAHSGLDFFAAAITLLAVRVADRPPDRNHQYGHGKVENLSALAQTLLLLVTCAWILGEALERLSTGHRDVDVNALSFVVIAVSIVVDFSRSRALKRVSRKYDSQALEADALHFSTDIYSSLVVIVGLGCVAAGFPEGDAIAASIVAGIVIWISLRLGKRTIDMLLDRAPEGLADRLPAAISAVQGVTEIRSLRSRQAGGRHFVNAVIGVHRLETFNSVHRIIDAVEDSVRSAFPRADVLVHAEPTIGKGESVRDAVAWLVQMSGFTAHNVLVLRVDGRFHIALDIEFPLGTTLIRAHEAATQVEKRIVSELPEVAEVSVHLEEDASIIVEAENAAEEEAPLLDRIKAALAEAGHVRRCAGISCFRTARGLKIALTCSIDDTLTLKQAHDLVNRIESDISAMDPRIVKVFVHTEPD